MSKKAEPAKKEGPPKKTEEKKPTAEAPKEAAIKEVEEAKPEKVAKPQKKKKQEKGIHALYKIEGEKVSPLRPICERCGPGYFMADHGNRFTCGHCGFTRYKPS